MQHPMEGNGTSVSSLFSWREWTLQQTPREKQLPQHHSNSSREGGEVHVPEQGLASRLVQQPVFISLACTSYRLSSVHLVLQSLLRGSLWPDRFFLFLSSTPRLRDEGVQEGEVPLEVEKIVREYPLTVVFTDNIGAHRKLLPLLSKYWHEDVVIVTVDDDTLYSPKFLASFIKTYIDTEKKAIIASRVRAISFCDQYPHSTLPYVYWNRKHCSSVKNEYLVLPTGVGGILYRPKFLHITIFDAFLRNMTKYNDDIQFRISSLLNNVSVSSACVAVSKKLRVLPNSSIDTYELYAENKHRNSQFWEVAVEYVNNWSGGRDHALQNLFARYLFKERNVSDCEHLDVPYTIDKIFLKPNKCGIYSCSTSQRIFRQAVNDNPVQALANIIHLTFLFVLYMFLRKYVSR